jgi:hypothetical protein
MSMKLLNGVSAYSYTMVLRGQFHNRNDTLMVCEEEVLERITRLIELIDLMSVGSKICYAISNVDECQIHW